MLKMEGREGEEYARISAPNHIGILWIVGSEIEVKLLTTVWLGAPAEDNHTHTEEKRGSVNLERVIYKDSQGLRADNKDNAR